MPDVRSASLTAAVAQSTEIGRKAYPIVKVTQLITYTNLAWYRWNYNDSHGRAECLAG